MDRQGYCWDSEDYLKHSTAQYKWAGELIDKLRLRGSESVLDIGCGDGKVTALISSHLPNGSVTGIDSSEEMVSFARRSFPEQDYPSLFFYCMDARNLTFENRFDIAFSNATLHWVEDHLSVLRGVKTGLKKSGRILFQMGGRGNAQDVVECVNEMMNMDTWKPYFKSFSFPYRFCAPEDYERWLAETGLKAGRVELMPKDMTHEGKEGLAGWFRTTWMPYLDRVPEKMRKKFIDTVVGMYVDRFPVDGDGLTHVKMVRLEIEAVKT